MTIRRVVMWIVVFYSISISESFTKTRTKRSNDENFNVLLNIYKMNPLKSSDTYKNYASRLLLPKPNSKVDFIPDTYSEETTKAAETGVNFKQIDDIIRLWDKDHVANSTNNNDSEKTEGKKKISVKVKVNPVGQSGLNDDMNIFYENFDVRGIGDDFSSAYNPGKKEPSVEASVVNLPVHQQTREEKQNQQILKTVPKKPVIGSDRKVTNLPKAPKKYEPKNLKNLKTEDDYVMIL